MPGLSGPQAQVLALQRTAGNAAVTRWLSGRRGSGVGRAGDRGQPRRPAPVDEPDDRRRHEGGDGARGADPRRRGQPQRPDEGGSRRPEHPADRHPHQGDRDVAHRGRDGRGAGPLRGRAGADGDRRVHWRSRRAAGLQRGRRDQGRPDGADGGRDRRQLAVHRPRPEARRRAAGRHRRLLGHGDLHRHRQPRPRQDPVDHGPGQQRRRHGDAPPPPDRDAGGAGVPRPAVRQCAQAAQGRLDAGGGEGLERAGLLSLGGAGRGAQRSHAAQRRGTAVRAPAARRAAAGGREAEDPPLVGHRRRQHARDPPRSTSTRWRAGRRSWRRPRRASARTSGSTAHTVPGLPAPARNAIAPRATRTCRAATRATRSRCSTARRASTQRAVRAVPTTPSGRRRCPARPRC